MRNVDKLLGEYGESHRNPFNEAIHWVCVPAIFFSIVGLIASIPAAAMARLEPWLGNHANWALPVLILLCIYYVTLSLRLAVGMVLFCAACLAAAGALADLLPVPLWGACLGIFAVSWVFQFIGHRVEGKKPSFLKDVRFLLIGPAWLLHHLYKKAGLRY